MQKSSQGKRTKEGTTYTYNWIFILKESQQENDTKENLKYTLCLQFPCLLMPGKKHQSLDIESDMNIALLQKCLFVQLATSCTFISKVLIFILKNQ